MVFVGIGEIAGVGVAVIIMVGVFIRVGVFVMIDVLVKVGVNVGADRFPSPHPDSAMITINIPKKRFAKYRIDSRMIHSLESYYFRN